MDTSRISYIGKLRLLCGAAVVCWGFLAASPARAQSDDDLCQPGEVIEDCLGRRLSDFLNGGGEKKIAAAAMKTAAAELKLADLSSFDSGALRPFLESLLAEIDGLATSGDEEHLKITYNAPNQKVSGEAVLHRAQVNAAVLEVYPEESREETKGILEKDLDDLDDVEAKLVLNYCTRENRERRIGRRVKDYADVFQTLVPAAITPALDVTVLVERLKEQQNLSARKHGSEDVFNLTWEEVKNTKDLQLIEDVKRLLTSTDLAESLEKYAITPFREEIKKSKVDEIFDLIANQPQIYVEVGGRFRDEAVGPTSWAAKFVWEMPQGRNVNKLFDYCRTGGTESIDLSCYQSYMDEPDTAASLRSKDRWKLELAGTGIESWQFRDPTSNEVLLDRDSDIKATLAAAYSRVLRYVQVRDVKTGELKDVEASRLDIEGAGEYVDNEETFVRRFKATVTLTNRINDDFDAALTFVWASDPEWRGEVDKDFSAHAGLRLKVGQTGG